ncbi:MAG: AAA family ATPase [Elusimicrobiales bacterium]|nr:AAA family ATPase [Elusimicrobiales bacterium]
MQKHFGSCNLSQTHIDIIRSVIYPELLIDCKLDDTNIIKIIDKKQEEVTRNLELGHYLLKGVAGSGKTVILISRAKFLSKFFQNWKILFICYNKSLASYLKTQLSEFKNIEISTYHKWCLKKLNKFDLIPFDFEPKTDEEFDIELPKKLLNFNNINEEDKYQAIIIDEGQDFDPLWYKTLLKFLDEKTNSLIIAVDSSQSIYNRKISWKSLGINIIGRTKIFRKNYRNTKQILEKAYLLIKDMDEKKSYSVKRNLNIYNLKKR